jgi:hypothetical protein
MRMDESLERGGEDVMTHKYFVKKETQLRDKYVDKRIRTDGMSSTLFYQ